MSKFFSPVDVYRYWGGMRMFSRPVSSAACERVFSYMEGMDREHESHDITESTPC
jgi:hypothetical protein